MENGLAVKTSSEDSGEASKNDTPSGGSSDEMDVDVSDSNNISGAIPITETGGAHQRRRCSSNTSVSTSVTSGIGTCSSVEEVPEMDFIKELDSEDEFVQAKSHHCQSGSGSSDQDEQEPEVDLKRKSSDSDGNLEDFSFLRVESNGSSTSCVNGAKCSKTENGTSTSLSSSSNQDSDNKCSFFSGPAYSSWLSDSKNGKMAASDALKEDNGCNNKRKQDQTTNNHSKKKHEGENEKEDDSDGVDDDDDDDDDNSSENPFDSPTEPSSVYPPYPTASSFDVYQPLPICAPPDLPPRKELPSVPHKTDDEDGEEEEEAAPGKRGEEEDEDQEPSGPTFRTYMKDKVDLLPIPSALKNFLLFYRT